MTNPEHISAVDAYADGELDPMRAVEVEKLMEARPELRQRYDSVLNLRAGLRAAAAQDPHPICCSGVSNARSDTEVRQRAPYGRPSRLRSPSGYWRRRRSLGLFSCRAARPSQR